MHSKPSQASKMELFAKIGTGFHPWAILVKSSTLDVWLDFKCASAYFVCFYGLVSVKQTAWQSVTIYYNTVCVWNK